MSEPTMRISTSCAVEPGTSARGGLAQRQKTLSAEGLDHAAAAKDLPHRCVWPLWLRRQEWSDGAITCTKEVTMNSAGSESRSSAGSFGKRANVFGWLWGHQRPRRGAAAVTMFELTDRLHHPGHTVRVPTSEIAATVSAWLAEVGADSPLVNDLASAARLGDWPAAYAIGDCLSIDVAIAG